MHVGVSKQCTTVFLTLHSFMVIYKTFKLDVCNLKLLVGATGHALPLFTNITGYLGGNFDLKDCHILVQEHWNRQHFCKNRTKFVSWYNHRLHSPNSRSSLTLVGSHAKWKHVLKEYANLHSLCIRVAGNLTEYFFVRNTSSGCKFVIAEAKTSMGNKVLLMTSIVV